MKGSATVLPTRSRYEEIFSAECEKEYESIDYLEGMYGYAIDRAWLEGTAFVLNCPVKVSAPNWQHGRVIYAVLRKLLDEKPDTSANDVLLDIGTAKGFSACVMAKALHDAGRTDITIESVDVVDPAAKVRRNTVAELDGFKSVHEVMSPFLPSGVALKLYGCGSFAVLEKLRRESKRVLFAFVDGKHSYAVVNREARLLSGLQRENDIAIFDDCQLPEVNRAVATLSTYAQAFVDIGVRNYSIARRV